MYRHNIEARPSGKTISITYSKCGSVALVIQHAMFMRHVILPVWLYHIFLQFRKNVIKHKMYLFNFCINLS